MTVWSEMSRMFRPATIAPLILLVGGLVQGTAIGATFDLLVPQDGSVVQTPKLLAVCRTLPGVRLAVQVDDQNIPIRDVSVPGDEEDLHHVWLELKEGRQRISWVDAGANMRLGETAVTYMPPYRRRAGSDKERFYRFHTKEREAACQGCHAVPEQFETVPGKPLSPAGKVCGACHPDVESAPHLHGPVAVYACFQCHEPEYSPARFTWSTPQGGTCDSCHEGYLTRILGGKKHVHGPVAAGTCVACHDPHGGHTTASLRNEVPKLCLQCHMETLPLPVERGLHGSEPCTRCHDPHGGQTEFLTRESGMVLCGTCHQDVAKMQTRGHPTDRHPVEAEADPSRPGKPMECVSCHDVHGIDDVARQGILANESLRKEFCRRCHE